MERATRSHTLYTNSHPHTHICIKLPGRIHAANWTWELTWRLKHQVRVSGSGRWRVFLHPCNMVFEFFFSYMVFTLQTSLSCRFDLSALLRLFPALFVSKTKKCVKYHPSRTISRERRWICLCQSLKLCICFHKVSWKESILNQKYGNRHSNFGPCSCTFISFFSVSEIVFFFCEGGWY